MQYSSATGHGRISPLLLSSKKGFRSSHHVPFTSQHRKHSIVAAATSFGDALKQLNSYLEKDDPEAEKEAVKLAQELKEEGTLKAFGAGNQVPKRIYTLEELRLNKIEAEKLLSPADETLNTVRTVLQGAGLLGLAAAFFGLHLEGSQLAGILVSVGFVFTADQIANGGRPEALFLDTSRRVLSSTYGDGVAKHEIANGGGLEALFVDTAGRIISSSYGDRVAFHEAGHFLCAYLVGLLPRRYTLSSLDALKKYGALNVQAGTLFCDADFQKEVASGTLSSSSLDKYTCIALAGVAAEYVNFGQAEGGLNDVQQLDGLLRALQFTQKKADGEIRWAILSVVTLLRRHRKTHKQLAKAMAAGKSVTECLAIIESNFAKENSKEPQIA